MDKITTIKGNLFMAPKGSILLHACNTKGIWGAGIAAQFAKRFPGAHQVYRRSCLAKGSELLGTCLLIKCTDYTVGCLFTSRDIGYRVDKPVLILAATRLAIADLIRQNDQNTPMHMCKINSRLFNVPWSDTKKVLKEFDKEFVVYDF